MFTHRCTCGGCGAEIDVLTTPGRDLDGQSEAMLLPDSMSVHRMESGCPYRGCWEVEEPVEVVKEQPQ